MIVIRNGTIIVLVLVALLLGCAPDKKNNSASLDLKPLAFSDIPYWQSIEILAPFKQWVGHCNHVSKNHNQLELYYSRSELDAVCLRAKNASIATEADARRFVEQYLVPYRLGGENGAFYTGYYRISLPASKTRSINFPEPLYKLPNDISANQLPSRKEIYDVALKSKGLENTYVRDKVDALFLQIQGSGQLLLTDGSKVSAIYAGKNHMPYVAVGKLLHEKGHLSKERLTAQRVYQWLKEHPDKAESIIEQNPSYIFFALEDDQEPKGGSGVRLTPYHSLAIDKSILPYGLPVLISTDLPIAENEVKPWASLMVTEDTGSAIKGLGRGDIYMGSGDRAAFQAGYLKHHGAMILLLPK